ncbi:Myb_DNA-binding domain-containing protein/Linker_histone domain-containing protein [Cephalotus follicularis]|uniref:MYB transcription factor n=1 Tax=Cephalotus follicularis TaxID=3775 RepID=A0A1Q3BYM5_CEPFO|nr:Myb_DNA-binding domain-containing protein/Linker_histone domain-containing protein [Cephalotus follicularis]
MGNPKQKWTSEEEEALRAGVAKHGTGKWKNIQRDPEFNPFLFSRSNIDLKDKWRNMSVSAGGQGPREKSRTPKSKPNSDANAAPVSTPQTSTQTSIAAPVARDTSSDVVMEDSSKSCGPKYTAMIFEALSALKEPDGSDASAIFSYIEQRHELPQNFRRLLSSRLRRLVAQEKLEKIQNCYKLKTGAFLGTKTPTPKQKDIRPKQLQSTGYMIGGDTVEEAALAAAYKVAEAENKSFVAAEAVKEAERVSKMAEDTDSLLQLAKEVFEKCSQGENVLMA